MTEERDECHMPSVPGVGSLRWNKKEHIYLHSSLTAAVTMLTAGMFSPVVLPLGGNPCSGSDVCLSRLVRHAHMQRN